MTNSQRPPRIAILAGPLGLGGIGSVVRDHCRRWPAAGLDVELLVARGDSPFTTQIDPAVRSVTVAALHPLWGVPALAAWLLRARPQAVVVHRPRLLRPLHAAMRLSGVHPRCVGAVHNLLSSELATDLAPRKRRALTDLARCDALVAASHAVARDTETALGLAPHTVAVAWPPIDRPTLLQRAQDTTTAPGLQHPPARYLLAVGRLEADKGFDILLQAFARLAPGQPGLSLVILGEGAERARLTSLASALGVAERVFLPGFAANPYPWMARAQALVLPSRREGFGIVLAEAMALGLPVIATHCPGPAEILDHGRFGRLVPVGDAHRLAEAVSATLLAPHPAPPAAVDRFDPASSTAVWLDALGIRPG